jgi:hypothetical protein
MSYTSETTTSSSSVSDIKVFNRDILDIRDPLEFAGARQHNFCIAQTYEVDKEQLPNVCNELYSHVLEKLRVESVGKVSVKINKYLDANLQEKEGPRPYIVISYETSRSTRCNMFIRFLPFGDNLYIGVDSYVLGSLNWWDIILRLILTLIPLGIIYVYLSITRFINLLQFPSRSSGDSGMGVFFCLIPLLLFILFLWIDTIRAVRHHGDLQLALRQTSNLLPSDQSFDNDDVLAFLKSSLLLIVFSIRDVFQKYDIPIRSLDETIVQNINHSVSISSQGGLISIVGSIIGGKGNKVIAN